MKLRSYLMRSVLLTASVTLFVLTGCARDETTDHPIAPTASDYAGHGLARTGDVAFVSYDTRLDDIRSYTRAKDIDATVEALDDFFGALSADVESGVVDLNTAEELAQSAQAIVIDIKIDIQFGTNMKCSPTFSCVDATQTCVSVTWKIPDVGGGRNCYNFGAAN